MLQAYAKPDRNDSAFPLPNYLVYISLDRMPPPILKELFLFFGCVVFVVSIPIITLVTPRQAKWMERGNAGLFVALLGALGFVIYTLDCAFALSESWVICLFLILLTCALATPSFLRKRSKMILIGCVVLGASICALHFVALSPVKPFRRFFTSINDGMTRSEILAELHRNFPDGGRFSRPVSSSDKPDHMAFILDPLNWAYNAEIVSLTLKDGKLVAKNYYGD